LPPPQFVPQILHRLVYGTIIALIALGLTIVFALLGVIVAQAYKLLRHHLFIPGAAIQTQPGTGQQ
jgi:hypothetical protein